MSKFIYLAGPINGCEEGEAKEWRKYVQSKFNKGIVGINPLRCEPPAACSTGKYAATYSDPKYGLARAIHGKNWLDTVACDFVLAYLPKFANDRRPSYGTVMEIGWASAMKKPICLVTDDPVIVAHPVVNTAANWILNTLDESVELVNGIFTDYTAS